MKLFIHKKIFYIVFFFTFIFFIPTYTCAKHVIGGNITYKCLGNGDYSFSLKVYRDCNCYDCAELDNIANIGIYRCNGDADCGKLRQDSVFAYLKINLSSKRYINQPTYPCLVSPNHCVEEGIYEFKLSNFNIRLPSGNTSYHISYQRCCRDNGISNIINPNQVGSTYSIEITPDAQAICNNSPEFKNFPPTIFFVNSILNYDHSAKDTDGDSLAYSFCSPFIGGGEETKFPIYQSCEGAYPTPACPPPYGKVTFQGSKITPSTPIASDPLVRIDSKTGIITGKPTIIGKFVLGICISEFRNGVLISQSIRDFQLIITDCDINKLNSIKGMVSTFQDNPVKFLKLSISTNSELFSETDENGEYDIKAVPKGTIFNMKINSNDYNFGITNLDLIILQKHLLGKDTLKTFQQLIAADVDNSKSITVGDLIQLKKLILNRISRFDKSPSWRFYPENYNFSKINYPYYLFNSDSIIISPIINDTLINFRAIKIGDISGVTGTSNVSDIDGNLYNIVKIGEQFWTKENLRVTKYRDGSIIPLVESVVTSGQTWNNNINGARTINEYSSTKLASYGYLYNWYAATNSKGICPTGLHIPTDEEWTTLANYLGGEAVAGGKMKMSLTTFWYSPNKGATNISGFSALPAGHIEVNGSFNSFKYVTTFWSSTEVSNHSSWSRQLYYSLFKLIRSYNDKSLGVSIRCIKD